MRYQPAGPTTRLSQGFDCASKRFSSSAKRAFFSAAVDALTTGTAAADVRSTGAEPDALLRERFWYSDSVVVKRAFFSCLVTAFGAELAVRVVLSMAPEPE